MSYKLITRTTIIYLLCASTLLLADETRDVYNLSMAELLEVKIVVAATGYEQKIAQAPATVSIILREEWQAMGATDLYEVLGTVAGIHIGMNASVTETSTILMRGLGGTGTQVKLLLNGQSFSDRTRAKVKTVGRFSLSGIKRIEVVKGPGSVVYGADAFAGIINLVSEEPGSDSDNHLTVKLGQYGAQDVSLGRGGQTNEFKWHWSVQSEKSDLTERQVMADAQTAMDLAPFSALTPAASNAPGFLQDWHDASNAIASFSYKAFSVELFNWQLKAGVPLGVTDRLDDGNKPVSAINARQSNLKVAYDLGTIIDSAPGELNLEFVYEDAFERSDFIIFPEGAVVLIGDDGNLFSAGGYPAILIDDGLYSHTGLITQTANIKVNHVFNANKQHGIRWEFGFETLELTTEFVRMFGPGVTDSVSLPRPIDGSPLILGAFGSGIDVNDSIDNQFILPSKRQFWFVSLQDEWRLKENVNLALGVRHDHYSDFGDTTNPRVGINWQVNDNFKMKAFSGTAFRAPSFGELYTRNNAVIDGNEHLQPESINTLELGFNYDLLSEMDLSFSATWYRFKTDNIIRDLPNPDTGKLLSQNTSGDKGSGIELEAQWKPLNQLSFKLNYSKSKLQNINTKAQRINIPDRLIYFNANWKISQSINWNLGIKSVAGRKRLPHDLREPIADYTALTTRLSWTDIVEGLTLAISGTNIGDDYVSEPGPQFLSNDIPMSGPIYKLELRYHF